MQIGDDFLLGCNYWPRKTAMYMWRDFDGGAIREEFAMIREIGLRYVRIFLLWESFQPEPGRVDDVALAHLRTVCDLAAEAGLKLQITFFTGHMSGPNWAPDWMLNPKHPFPKGERQLVSLNRTAGSTHWIYNVYTEPFLIEAEKLLLMRVVEHVKDHPAVWAYSLGNEPDLFCKPPDARTGKQWVAEMVRTIKSIDPDKPVLIGLHSASIDGDVGLRVDHIAGETDISVMHGYSIYHPLARKPLDPDYVPFTAGVTAALAGRPVLYEEFGVNTQWPDGPSHWEDSPTWDGETRKTYFASEADAAEYYAEVLPRLHRMGCLGAFAWCFPDYDPSLWHLPPNDFQKHERFFGLYRADGSIKPMGEAVKKFAAIKPKIQPAEKTVKLPVSADEYYRDPLKHLAGMYERFGKL